MKIYIYLLLTVTLLSCGSEDMSRFFYIYDNAEFTEKRENPLPYTILVNNLSASSWLQNRQIAVRPQANRIDYYDQYAWIAQPGELFAEQIYEVFKGLNAFSMINRHPSEGQADYFVGGYINHLEFVREGDSLYAWVEFKLKLQKTNSRKPIFSFPVEEKMSLGEDTKMQTYVAKVSALFNREIITFAKRCEEVIEQRKP